MIKKMLETNSKVFFITHPNVVIDKNVPVPNWPLSEKGVERMQKLLSKGWVKSISSIYCSSEQKAIDGAKILADHLKLPYKIVPDLGENDRSSTGYLPKDQFEEMANEFFSKPNLSIRGWESAKDAQGRIFRAIIGILENDQDTGNIAIVSHGGVGALLLCKLAKFKISRKHDQPGEGGGNVFVFDKNLQVLDDWSSID